MLSCTFLYWSLGFSKQEYWNGLSFPSPGDLPRAWTQGSHIAGRFFAIWATREVPLWYMVADKFPMLLSMQLDVLSWSLAWRKQSWTNSTYSQWGRVLRCALQWSRSREYQKLLIFLKRSLVFPILLFSSISLHWSLRNAFLSLLAILWNSAFKCVYLSFSPLLFASLLFTAICKAFSDSSHFAFSHFFFLGMVLLPVSCTMSWTSIHSSSGTLLYLVP